MNILSLIHYIIYRWNEEEAYKLLKSRIELENFSGKNGHGSKTRFLCKNFIDDTMCGICTPDEEKVTNGIQSRSGEKVRSKNQSN